MVRISRHHSWGRWYPCNGFYPDVDLFDPHASGEAERWMVLKRPIQFRTGCSSSGRDCHCQPEFNLVARTMLQSTLLSMHRSDFPDASGSDRFGVESCFAFDNTPGAKALPIESFYGDEKTGGSCTGQLAAGSFHHLSGRDRPVVTGVNSIGAGLIAGTRYGAVCWTNSCDYNQLSLRRPTPS